MAKEKLVCEECGRKVLIPSIFHDKKLCAVCCSKAKKDERLQNPKQKVKQQLSKAKSNKTSKDNNTLIENLGTRGEKLLTENIHSDEQVIIKLKGTFGEGFVVTNKRVYVLKWGYMAGNLIGGRCLGFEYDRITAIELKKNWTTGTLEVLTPSTQNAQKSYWGKGQSNAVQSDNVVTFQRNSFDKYTSAVTTARELLANANKTGGATSDYADLEKLAELLGKGIITEKEFAAKKKQILGL